MGDATYKKTLRAVNSKALANQVIEFVDDAIASLGVSWSSESHRGAFVQLVEEYLQEIQEVDNKIEQYKVICDRRNNKSADMENGIFNVEVQYRQKNCLNVTKILYSIRTNNGPLKVEPDFVI